MEENLNGLSFALHVALDSEKRVDINSHRKFSSKKEIPLRFPKENEQAFLEHEREIELLQTDFHEDQERDAVKGKITSEFQPLLKEKQVNIDVPH